MKRFLMTVLCGVALLWTAQASAQEAKKIKTLFVTGEDVGVHKWNETTPALRKLLEASGKFQVVVCEDTHILESKDALKGYDLLILNYFNTTQPTLSQAAKDNMVEFVKGGKGFVPFHLSSAAFKEWDEFHKMVGRYWVMGKSGHGDRGKFKVQIADKDNPITKGLKDFEADDELYAKLLGEEKIHVLVQAESDFSKKTEPLAFILEYGKGRVYHHAFGHDVAAVEKPPEVGKLFVRGAEWAATGKVTE